MQCRGSASAVLRIVRRLYSMTSMTTCSGTRSSEGSAADESEPSVEIPMLWASQARWPSSEDEEMMAGSHSMFSSCRRPKGPPLITRLFEDFRTIARFGIVSCHFLYTAGFHVTGTFNSIRPQINRSETELSPRISTTTSNFLIWLSASLIKSKRSP